MKPHRHSASENIRSDARTFFATSSVYQQRALFRTQRFAELMLDTVFHYRLEGKYKLYEFVVMPDHFHLLITLDASISIEKAIQFVKGGFSFRAKKELGSNSEIWQRGFSESRVLHPEQYLSVKKYIWNNPVAGNWCTVQMNILIVRQEANLRLTCLQRTSGAKARSFYGSGGTAEAMP